LHIERNGEDAIYQVHTPAKNRLIFLAAGGSKQSNELCGLLGLRPIRRPPAIAGDLFARSGALDEVLTPRREQFVRADAIMN
jgi:hypothetical protein